MIIFEKYMFEIFIALSSIIILYIIYKIYEYYKKYRELQIDQYMFSKGYVQDLDPNMNNRRKKDSIIIYRKDDDYIRIDDLYCMKMKDIEKRFK